MPILSVVVISYNDVERLPNAIESVLQQDFEDLELLIVDDFSSDTTPSFVASVAKGDGRVRSFRLSTNSGGCSAPRNTGLSNARGKYVMFLDSDDVLLPGACRRLVEAAESSGADFVAGSLERVHQESGLTEAWYGDLYEREMVTGGIQDRPELVVDTIVTNKLFRTSFLHNHGLQFPLGMQYEDVAFMAEVLTLAKKIHYVPELVYQWRVYGQDAPTSITNQRTLTRNYSDRARAVEIVRSLYASQGPEVRALADSKALKHHFMLHLNDSTQMSNESLTQMLEVFAPVIAKSSPDAIAALTPFEAAKHIAVLAGSADLLLEIFEREPTGVLPGKLVRNGLQEMWQLPNAPSSLTPDAEQFLTLPFGSDVSSSHSALIPAALLEDVTAVSGGFQLVGRVEIRNLQIPESGFLVVTTGETVTMRSPVTLSRDSDANIIWSATLAGMRGSGLRHAKPLELHLDVPDNGTIRRLPIHHDLREDVVMPDTSLIGILSGDKWHATRSGDGKVAFSISAGPVRARFQRLLAR